MVSDSALDFLAFGAHPDDIELTCGGTLARLSHSGYRVGAVSLTAGELGTRGDMETRASEMARAAEILGVAHSGCLGLPDGALRSSDEQRLAVIRCIRELKPNLVAAPYWVDRHPDHARASRLVSEAGFLAGLRKIDTGQPPHRPWRVLFYPSRVEFEPTFIVDVSAYHETKMNAVRAYRSQFDLGEGSQWDGAETNISHAGFLEAVEARGRQYGAYIGTRFGEAFLVREPLRLDDPPAFFGPGYLKAFL